MTTKENVKNNSSLKWLLDNSEITFDDSECTMTYFKGKVPSKMLSDLKYWFNDNGGNMCGGSVKVGQGSVNLTISKWKGSRDITFTTCLAK